MLYRRFSLVLCFMHSRMYLSVPVSQFLPLLPSFPRWNPHICSLHLCLYFCFANSHLYYFSRRHIYVLTYIWQFSRTVSWSRTQLILVNTPYALQKHMDLVVLADWQNCSGCLYLYWFSVYLIYQVLTEGTEVSNYNCICFFFQFCSFASYLNSVVSAFTLVYNFSKLFLLGESISLSLCNITCLSLIICLVLRSNLYNINIRYSRFILICFSIVYTFSHIFDFNIYFQSVWALYTSFLNVDRI